MSTHPAFKDAELQREQPGLFVRIAVINFAY